jgi:pyruvate carboxylase
MDIETLLAERDRISTTLRAIKTGAAEISQLLAEEVLGGDEWERAVRVLAECRAERKRLDDRLLHIDASIALLERSGRPNMACSN